jgi:hypothetical protein
MLKSYLRVLLVRALGLLLLIGFVERAAAGPPFVTDDPEPVETHHWEINYAITKTWFDDGASAGIPSVDINYGVVPNVQLHAQPRYSYEREGSGVQTGIDDTEIGAKIRFVNIGDEQSSFMVGIYPMYQLPTGATRLGPTRGKRQVFLPLWIQRDIDQWTFYGGWGYRHNPGEGNRDSKFLGGTALYKFTPSLQLGGEVFHQTPDAVDGKSATGFNFGGTYTLNKSHNLLFSAGKGLSNVSDTNEFSLYVALQVLR